MECKQPTFQQLAYLDELKERLQELRKRQETFMEETAEMLRTISTEKVIIPEDDVEECSLGIKQLIQRFEDLRQTSRQFGEQPLPEELAGVDVRKLLKGYERLILEGKKLQQSWLLLKKTTENCAHHSESTDERMLNKLSSKSSSFAEQTPEGDSLCDKTIDLLRLKPSKSGIELAQAEAYKEWSSCGNRDKGKCQRSGVFILFGLCMNLFRKRAKRNATR